MENEQDQPVDLSAELGPKNNIDVVAGQCYFAGVEHSNQKLMRYSQQIAELSTEVNFHHDKFGQVEALVRDATKELEKPRLITERDTPRIADGWKFQFYETARGKLTIGMTTAAVINYPGTFEGRNKELIDEMLSLVDLQEDRQRKLTHEWTDGYHCDYQWQFLSRSGELIGEEMLWIHGDGEGEMGTVLVYPKSEEQAEEIWERVKNVTTPMPPKTTVSKYPPPQPPKSTQWEKVKQKLGKKT